MTGVIDKTLEELFVGDSASFTRTVTDDDVTNFVALSGDVNPLHTDPNYAATTKFKKPIVHGMFLGALCSQLIGAHLPGKRSLYLSQELVFKNPVYVGDTVSVTGTITNKSTSTRIVEIAMVIRVGETVVASGTAKVQVLN